jgi:hypothetical protein
VQARVCVCVCEGVGVRGGNSVANRLKQDMRRAYDLRR